jgi:hypothetical protein
MKTQVLFIKNIEAQLDSSKRKTDALEVVVLLGEVTKQFIFTVKKTVLGNRTLLTFVEDTNFSNTFRFNDHIAIEITNLVKRTYQGEIITFPIVVGDFGTAEEALAQQKPFERKLVRKK